MITDPRRTNLDDPTLRAVGRVPTAAGAGMVTTTWLTDHIACDVVFDEILRERVELLKDVPVDALVETAERIRLTAGARTLVRTMRTHGAYTILVSGGLKFFSSRIAMAVGFDSDESNQMEITGDRLTGKVQEPILDRTDKCEVLRRTARERNVPLTETLAVGDGANDLPMIKGPASPSPSVSSRWWWPAPRPSSATAT